MRADREGVNETEIKDTNTIKHYHKFKMATVTTAKKPESIDESAKFTECQFIMKFAFRLSTPEFL